MWKSFNSQGTMIVPSRIRGEIKEITRMQVVKSCFCPQGHNLINSGSFFNGNPGILLRIRNRAKDGYLNISPIYGDKNWISINCDLDEGEMFNFFCPDCNSRIPTHSICGCGASFLALFNDPSADFSDCIGFCNRVGCTRSVIHSGREMLALACIDNFIPSF